MKIIALYLPQYHQIPENDLWWGKGYTEWDSCKRGCVMIPRQYQPRVPKGGDYYNLLDDSVKQWQVDLAKEYGIYGFCVYHYWFNGKLVLEKPMEQYLANKNLDLPFFFCWANENWTTIWAGKKDPDILLTHDYSDKNDWIKHFEYYLPFFQDERYMKENNKPILCIYNPISIEAKYLEEMLSTWDDMAKQNGFDGLVFTYQCGESLCCMDKEQKDLFDYAFEYEPALRDILKENKEGYRKIYKRAKLIAGIKRMLPFLKKVHLKHKQTEQIQGVKTVQEYDEVWNDILSIQPESDAIIPGAFTDWDNTPRRKEKGKVILGASPQKFEQYMIKLIDRAHSVYKKDVIIVFAWNEWSEGGYLEPDEHWGHGYLEAVRNALIHTNHWPVVRTPGERIFEEK